MERLKYIWKRIGDLSTVQWVFQLLAPKWVGPLVVAVALTIWGFIDGMPGPVLAVLFLFGFLALFAIYVAWAHLKSLQKFSSPALAVEVAAETPEPPIRTLSIVERDRILSVLHKTTDLLNGPMTEFQNGMLAILSDGHNLPKTGRTPLLSFMDRSRDLSLKYSAAMAPLQNEFHTELRAAGIDLERFNLTWSRFMQEFWDMVQGLESIPEAGLVARVINAIMLPASTAFGELRNAKSELLQNLATAREELARS